MSHQVSVSYLFANPEDAAAFLAKNTGGQVAAAPAAAEKPAAKAKAESKPAATTTSKYSRSDMNAALNDVKEKKGAPAAKKIIKEVGGADKMNDIAEAKIDEVYEAAKKELGGDDDDI